MRKFTLLFLVALVMLGGLLGWAGSSLAAVAFVSGSCVDQGSGTTTTVTMPFTVGSEANRALYVCLTTANGLSDEHSNPTFNGDAMTLLAHTSADATNDVGGYLFRLVNPDTVTNGTVSITLGTGRRAVVCSAYFSGVDQTTPDDTPVTSDGGDVDVTSVSVNVTTATDDMIVDCAGKRNSSQTFVMGTQTNRTEIAQDVTTSATAGNNVYGGMSRRTGTGSLAMNWTTDTTNGFVVLGTNINASVTATQRPSLGMFLLGR